MKLWGGRFGKETEDIVHRFTSSLSFDRRLARQDLRVTEAHALALRECGILSPDEYQRVLSALRDMGRELEEGSFPIGGDEDIHSAVERVLVERLGETGAKLRTARSRNDQVAADLRLYLMEEAAEVMHRLTDLMEVFLDLAEEHLGVIMPGFTHLQPAQPVLLSHHLLAYFEMFKRDLERFAQARSRMDRCPLGSGALAGVGFPLDRWLLAEESGFGGITANSVDAVSDRDFAADFLYAAALTSVHLSRLAEEIVMWMNPRFGFLRLDEAYTTGSSIMPQKANPDLAELIRGKAGRMVGHLVSLLVMLKGQPLAYNRDLQEDKEGVFDAAEQLRSMLEITAAAMRTAEFDRERMLEAAAEGYLNATDLADYLVGKGVPFLRAHEAAGKAVRMCLDRGGIPLEELSLEDLRALEPSFEEDVYSCLSLQECVKARDLPGGTSPGRVEEALREARDWLEAEGRRLTR
ncbi:MAG: argininosuccinate lyase [Actinobacteria bacterium]|nr:argininosuccinate lyase [Actinomycetota bacterium]